VSIASDTVDLTIESRYANMVGMANYVHTDGGRAKAGFPKGKNRDCFVRAVAVATQREYADMYALVKECGADLAPTADALRGYHPDDGIMREVADVVMRLLGWQWVPTMHVGKGCTVHAKASELPAGRIVLRLSRHYAAAVDGVVHDNHDSTRGGTRCVYGYWKW